VCVCVCVCVCVSDAVVKSGLNCWERKLSAESPSLQKFGDPDPASPLSSQHPICGGKSCGKKYMANVHGFAFLK
jgi:hypothetical protein